ncbi:MAG: hypothetical protein EHM38_01530, partial [Geobacteraceae bacterium]
RTRADAELVLLAYEAWGKECLTNIDGDFALVIWDARRKQAFCARDRMGNKPFLYHWDGKTLTFTSELHAVLGLPWVEQKFNVGMLAEFLGAEWLSRDETFWQGILRLEAAHCMEVGKFGPSLTKYWAPDVWMTLPYIKDEDYVEHYRALFADVVRRMSRSHLPLACEVSGGLDSSAIFAMAVHLCRRNELPAPGTEGYTLNFRGVPDADELEYCKAVAKHLGRNIQEIPPTKAPLSWYRDWARRYGEFPGYPNGIMSLGIREKASADGSRVLLVGVGGDEWVDGSQTYFAEALAAGRWGELYQCIETDFREVGIQNTVTWFLRAGIFPLLPNQIRAALRKILTRGKIHGVDREAWLTPAMRHLIHERRARYTAAHPEQIKRVGQRGQLNMLAGAYSIFARETEERLCSHAGLELRRPFWDPRIVQFSFVTPERLRLRGRTTKTLHRTAMIGLLPEKVLMRETKADFMIAFRQYMPEMKETLTRNIPARHPEWILTKGVVDLYEQSGKLEYSGWPEWMMWSLFGCDALL